jgi:hypothetical protein
LTAFKSNIFQADNFKRRRSSSKYFTWNPRVLFVISLELDFEILQKWYYNAWKKIEASSKTVSTDGFDVELTPTSSMGLRSSQTT